MKRRILLGLLAVALAANVHAADTGLLLTLSTGAQKWYANVAQLNQRSAGYATLGSELVTNGTFTTDLTGWTISGTGTGWTHSAGALHGAGNTETISQSVNLTDTELYFVWVEASGATAGTLTMTFGALTGSYVVANGYTFAAYQATSTAGFALTFTPSTDYDGKLTSVSVKQIAATLDPVILSTNDAGDNGLELRSLLLPSGVANSGAANNNTVNYDHPASWGAQSVAIGYRALEQNITGYQNTVIGAQAMQLNVTGSYNTGVGQGILYGNTTGHNNTAVGMAALQYNTTGSYNSALGWYSLYANLSGDKNTAVGGQALGALTTGSMNTAVGYQALGVGPTTVSSLTAVGYAAMRGNTSGTANTGIGNLAGYATTTGGSNTSVGNYALYSNSTASNSTAVGDNAVASSNAAALTGVGAYALGEATTGANNTAIGYRAGRTGTVGNATTTGANNTYVGADSGQASATQRTNSTAIGYGATVDADNTVVLGNASVTEVLASSDSGATFSGAGFKAGGSPGLTTIITVRDSGGSADCTITVTGGIITATTCSHT